MNACFPHLVQETPPVHKQDEGSAEEKDENHCCESSQDCPEGNVVHQPKKRKTIRNGDEPVAYFVNHYLALPRKVLGERAWIQLFPACPQLLIAAVLETPVSFLDGEMGAEIRRRQYEAVDVRQQ